MPTCARSFLYPSCSSPIGKAFNAFRMPSGDTDAITEAPVKGVVKAWHHSSFAFDALILEDGGAENSKFAPDGGFSMAVVRLRKGASADELERKLNAIDMGTKRIGAPPTSGRPTRAMMPTTILP